MKKLIVLLFFSPLFAFAQSKPFINSISPTHVEVGQTITISGSNLSTVNQVFFGGVSVAPSSTSANTVTAVVPAGATHGEIVVQTTGNLSTSSTQQFLLSFSGSDITNYDNEYLVSTGLTDAYDICMCDLNGDGLNDLAINHNANTGSEVTVYLNNTSGTGSFTGTDFQISQTINNGNNNTGSLAITCGDLNHDGAPELVFSSNGVTSLGDVFIYQNDGSGNMSASGFLKLPAATSGNRGARKVRIADIDEDGNPDLVIGNSTDGLFLVYQGNGDLTFDGTADQISVSGTINTSSLNLADFNNDGKQDVASIPFRESNQNISILRNTSGPGSVSFVQENGINASAQRINLETADFDGDGFIDIVTTNQQLQRVSVYRNTTSSIGSSITFASGIDVAISGAGAWGVDIGDMNGDGQPDIIVGSTSTIDDLFVIENTSSTGSISFASPTAIPTSNTNLNVVVGDLNGDARPDIAYTHNIQAGNPGNLGILLNRNCVEPIITPSNLEFCSGDQFVLQATKTQGAFDYDWQITSGTGTIDNDNGDNADITITSGPAIVEVTIIHDNGETYECSESGTASFTITGGSQPDAPSFDAGSSDNICIGDSYSITISDPGLDESYDEFEWTKPDGGIEIITPGAPTTTSSLDITNATLEDAGIYLVRGRLSGGCYSEQSSAFILEVGQPPLLAITNNDLDDFCEGTSVTLEVPDFTSDFTYQWKRNGTDIGGENGATISTAIEGNYTVEVTDPNTCMTETSSYTINEVTSPTSVADGPTETCVGFETSFTSSSTGEGSFTLQYEWVVNDGLTDIHTASTQDLDFIFPASGSYTVTLTTAYPETEVYAGGPGILCENSDILSITVSNPPSVTFDVTNNTRKCPSDTITITPTLSSGTVSSITWVLKDALDNSIIENSELTSSSLSPFDGYTPQGVDSVYAVASITNDIGCVVLDSVSLKNFDNSNLTISEAESSLADTTINGVTYPLIELTDEIFVELNASGGSDYSWSSGGIPDNFDRPEEATTTFFPSQPLSLVTLSGTDGNNCDETFTLAVYLDNFRPRKTFSPNGDGRNDCWEILNIGQLGNEAGCKVYVFDSRGRTIITKENFDGSDNCVWDGNFNNSPVPEGVYYYVMKCESSNVSKSGSILLAR